MGDGSTGSGIGDAIGGAAMFPARAAARAWRGRIESAAEDMLSAPETARIVDRALAGRLPEDVAHSLVRHHVVERVIRELAASGELEVLIEKALGNPQTLELVECVLASEEMQLALRRIASGPEIRSALVTQSTSLGGEVVQGLRVGLRSVDDRVEHAVRRRARAGQPWAGVASRGLALAADTLLVTAVVAIGGALVGEIASLVGGVRPHWLAGTLVAVGWVLVTGGYFALFWSAAGQTPGMRLLGVRVRRSPGDARIGLGRAVVRTIGLALAIIPCFLGFVPALFDSRRRALPDYMAGTTVVYDETAAGDPSD
ncbi:MAG TPA: RDD family protein [Solirubrobacteraceae bacterium]|nr:RDD family protein [Solirubrobacteraceae bacterium]